MSAAEGRRDVLTRTAVAVGIGLLFACWPDLALAVAASVGVAQNVTPARK